MARVLVTGSSTGLGLMAARLLADEGHSVIAHGRDRKRADDALKAVPEAVRPSPAAGRTSCRTRWSRAGLHPGCAGRAGVERARQRDEPRPDPQAAAACGRNSGC